jgi:SAM-dependent methyltransferase
MNLNTIITEWKNKDIPEQQLKLNKYELENNYPSHWSIFIYLINVIKNNENNFEDYTLFDLGCGVGTTYKLLCNNKINCKYIGYDFSEHMISLAKKEWNYEHFYVKDIYELSNINTNNILYCTGLLDILPDGNKGLKHLLQLKVKYIILNRINISEEETISLYKAYDTINCIKYVFSKIDFINIIKESGYIIKECIQNGFLLEYKY